METEKKSALINRLENWGFRYGGGDVCLTSPDGVYFNFNEVETPPFTDNAVQLIIVGPMNNRPGTYAKMVGKDYLIKSCAFMQPGDFESEEFKQIFRDHGFISLIVDVK